VTPEYHRSALRHRQLLRPPKAARRQLTASRPPASCAARRVQAGQRRHAAVVRIVRLQFKHRRHAFGAVLADRRARAAEMCHGERRAGDGGGGSRGRTGTEPVAPQRSSPVLADRETFTNLPRKPVAGLSSFHSITPSDPSVFDCPDDVTRTGFAGFTGQTPDVSGRRHSGKEEECGPHLANTGRWEIALPDSKGRSPASAGREASQHSSAGPHKPRDMEGTVTEVHSSKADVETHVIASGSAAKRSIDDFSDRSCRSRGQRCRHGPRALTH
jgi:hypothetical protein